MNKHQLMKLSCILVLGAFAGCSAISQQSVFTDVQKDLEARSGYTATYSPGDEEVTSTITDYLKDGLTVDEAVRIALLNNQELQATYEKLGIRRGELIEAGLLRNPVFEAEIHFEGGGIGTGTNLNIIQEFMSVFQLPLRRKIAASSLEAAKAEVLAAVLNLIYDTEATFYSVQGAEQILELRNSIFEGVSASAEIAKRQKQAGNVTALQYASETVQYAKAKRELAGASAHLFDEHEKLNLLLGLWGENTHWQVSNRLPELPINEISATGLESLAIRQSPELSQARFEIEALAGELGISRGFRLIPEFQLGVDAEGEDGGKVTVGPNLSLPIPIFNQGQGLIAQGESRLREAQRMYVSKAVKVRSEVRRAYNRLALARTQAEFDKKHLLPLTQEAVKNSQLEYNAMLVGVFDLLKVKQEQIEAGKTYVETLRDYWIARSELKKATGGNLPIYKDPGMSEEGHSMQMSHQEGDN